ncbi:MAG: hypothetical protein EOO01_01595 [Chitinophagaceae bacterium]|nr:MAG: hypothetical protein EOO01_01595 [Chitinophagaceae bacterium]
MNNLRCTLFLTLMVVLASCQQTGSNVPAEKESYKIGLHPVVGSNYQYEIKNETSFVVEVDDKEIDNLSKTDVSIRYGISKDSAGDFLFAMNYDKIRLYTKKGDLETDLDAANAPGSINQIEKMLGLLKTATITSRVTPSGKVVGVTGYEGLGAKMFDGLHEGDSQMKTALLQQWDKLAGETIVQKNMDQFFSIFPDSIVKVGSTWEQSNVQAGELPMTINTTYKLKSVDKDVAVIAAEGKVTNKANASNLMGYSNVKVTLDGTQRGSFEINVSTGMLLKASIKSDIKGELNMMGKEIPVTIKNVIDIKGGELKK